MKLYLTLTACLLAHLNATSTTYDMWDWIRHDNWATHHLDAHSSYTGHPTGNRLQNSSTLFWIKFQDDSPNFEKYELSGNNIYLRQEGMDDSEYRFWGNGEYLFVPRYVSHGTTYYTNSGNFYQCWYDCDTSIRDSEIITGWLCEIRFKQNFVGFVNKDNQYESLDVIELSSYWHDDGTNTCTDKYFFAQEYGCVLFEYWEDGSLVYQMFFNQEISGAYSESAPCGIPAPCNFDY